MQRTGTGGIGRTGSWLARGCFVTVLAACSGGPSVVEVEAGAISSSVQGPPTEREDAARPGPPQEKATPGVAAATPDSRDAVSESPSKPAAAVPGRPGDENDRVVVAVPRLPAGLDPLADLDPVGHRVVEDLLFEGLTRPMAESAPFAALALARECRLEPPLEPRQVRCRLRDDAVFSDGSKVTLADVESSLRPWLDPRRADLRARYGLAQLESLEVQGVTASADTRSEAPRSSDGTTARPDGWIRIVFSASEPLLLEKIAAMKVFRARRGRGLRGRDPMGTGPYELVVRSEDHLVFERKPVPPRGGAEGGGAKRLELRKVPDGAKALTLLRRGDVHLVTRVSPVHVPVELTKAGMGQRFRAYLTSPARFDVLFYNHAEGATAGPRFRRALDLAIPIERMRRDIDGGLGRSVRAPVDLHDPTPIDLERLAEAGLAAAPGMAGLPEGVVVRRDADRNVAAAALLDELGFALDRSHRQRAGSPLRVVLAWTGGSGRPSELASAIRDAWRGLGITVPYATSSWTYLESLLGEGKFEVVLARLATSTDADLYPWLHSRGSQNFMGLSDRELDEALVAFRRAATRDARQEAKRAIASRLEAIHAVSVVAAPAEVVLVSRALRVQFLDDCVRLDAIVRVEEPPSPGAAP